MNEPHREPEYPRLPARFIVELEREKRPPTAGRHTLKNVSLGGVCIETEYPLPIGEHVRLSFSVPIQGKEVEIVAQSTVVWSSETRMALRFDILKSRPAEAISEYLRIQGLGTIARSQETPTDSTGSN